GSVAFVANVPPPLLAANLNSDSRILLREQLPLRDIAHSTQTDHNEHGCKHRAADDRNAAALRPWLQSQRIGPFRRTAQEPSQQHDHHGKPDRSADGGEQPDQKREMLGLRSLRIESGLPAAAGAKETCRRRDAQRFAQTAHRTATSFGLSQAGLAAGTFRRRRQASLSGMRIELIVARW